MNNGVLNMLPEGGEVMPMHAKLQKAGKKTGLVTTATITHATPAGFAANVDSRAAAGVTAGHYLARRGAVLRGGGQ